jgi:hypothetical protein
VARASHTAQRGITARRVCVADISPLVELRHVCAHFLCPLLTFDINGETPVAAVLLEFKQAGTDAEAVACHIKPSSFGLRNLPIILLSAYSEMRERIPWLADEYVMKSELPEQLVPILGPAQKRAPRCT